mmetsp:Transcript_6195/g.9035  ORF Transcript_6195/g.9035 Transcript_6195/m.9035 type:complete len:391 (+) Transcript_6195:92-1264(+)
MSTTNKSKKDDGAADNISISTSPPLPPHRPAPHTSDHPAMTVPTLLPKKLPAGTSQQQQQRQHNRNVTPHTASLMSLFARPVSTPLTPLTPPSDSSEMAAPDDELRTSYGSLARVDSAPSLPEEEEESDEQSIVSTDHSNGGCNNSDKHHEEEEEEDWYVGPNGISSLHVIAETTTKDGNAAAAATNKKNSELLAKRYGPNATIQYYKPAKTKASSSQSNTNNNNSQQYNHNQLTSPSLHNILGKYLVHQKNTFHSNPQKRKLLQLQHQLCHVEQLASVMITEEVRRNPPKCLMAMIGPAAASSSEGDSCENMNGQDDENVENSRNEESATNATVKAVVGKTVGAWQGPGRVPGEQGGGAPCPETFLLRQEERRNNGLVAPHDVIVADET